jgi:RNA polymerase sigma-70 factor (ECF subfamily)
LLISSRAFSRPDQGTAVNPAWGRSVLTDVAGNTELGAQFLDVLYRRHYCVLLRYAQRLTNGDRFEAEDITQETLLRAWQHADSLDMDLDTDNVLRWLYVVARNLAISRLYRGRRSRTVETTLDTADLCGSEDDLERVLESWQMIDAMRTLSLNHRAVLVELFYRRKSIAETASALGVPPGTVKSRCHYGLRALADALQERGVLTA